jgi:hypothetical protein
MIGGAVPLKGYAEIYSEGYVKPWESQIQEADSVIYMPESRENILIGYLKPVDRVAGYNRQGDIKIRIEGNIAYGKRKNPYTGEWAESPVMILFSPEGYAPPKLGGKQKPLLLVAAVIGRDPKTGQYGIYPMKTETKKIGNGVNVIRKKPLAKITQTDLSGKDPRNIEVRIRNVATGELYENRLKFSMPAVHSMSLADFAVILREKSTVHPNSRTLFEPNRLNVFFPDVSLEIQDSYTEEEIRR